MKIAIAGGGFFGCYIARFLNSHLGGEAQIHIFDRAPRPMMRVAINNQARLHLGFHYPRSPETIRQTMKGFSHFVREFASRVSFPRSNLYAVHREGHLSFEEYLSALDACGLSYELSDKSEYRYFVDDGQIEGVIKVAEGVIDLHGLRLDLLRSLRAEFIGNSNVTEIDCESGELIVNKRLKGPYDLVINATYTNPNLGLSSSKTFEVKYELACMVLMRHPFSEDVAITIMDGGFVSLYPWGNGLATLSSVLYTPYRFFESLDSLEQHMLTVDDGAERKRAALAILKHSQELLCLDGRMIDIKGIRCGPKCKQRNDLGDTRVSSLRFDGRLVSILAGKLDACHPLAEFILKYILGEHGEEFDREGGAATLGIDVLWQK